MVQKKCKLNNTELSASNCFIFRAKKLETTRTTKEQQNLQNSTVRFCLNIDIRKEMEDSRLNAIKQPIPFVKGRLNFSSKTTTAGFAKNRPAAQIFHRFIHVHAQVCIGFEHAKWTTASLNSFTIITLNNH